MGVGGGGGEGGLRVRRLAVFGRAAVTSDAEQTGGNGWLVLGM